MCVITCGGHLLAWVKSIIILQFGYKERVVTCLGEDDIWVKDQNPIIVNFLHTSSCWYVPPEMEICPQQPL